MPRAISRPAPARPTAMLQIFALRAAKRRRSNAEGKKCRASRSIASTG
jgi:hypothetical protein